MQPATCFYLAESDAMIMVPVFGGFAVIATIAIVLSIRHERKRTEALAGIAEQMGLSFDAQGTMPAGAFNQAPLFDIGRSRKTKNVMTGRVEDIQLHLFDYQYTTGSGKHATTHKHTVAAVEVQGFDLPKFHLKPEHFGHKIASVFGFDDIDFSDYPTSPVATTSAVRIRTPSARSSPPTCSPSSKINPARSGRSKPGTTGWCSTAAAAPNPTCGRRFCRTVSRW